MDGISLLAQVSAAGAIAHWAIILIVIAGIVGILLVTLRSAGVTVPPFIVTILWIVLAIVVGVFAIRFIASYV